MTVGDGDGWRAASPRGIRFDADLPGFDRSYIPPAVTTLLPARPPEQPLFLKSDHSFSRIVPVVLWKPRLTLSIVVSSQPSRQHARQRLSRKDLVRTATARIHRSVRSDRFRLCIPPPFASCRQGRDGHIRRHVANLSDIVCTRHSRCVCMDDEDLQLKADAGRIRVGTVKYMIFRTILSFWPAGIARTPLSCFQLI